MRSWSDGWRRVASAPAVARRRLGADVPARAAAGAHDARPAARRTSAIEPRRGERRERRELRLVAGVRVAGDRHRRRRSRRRSSASRPRSTTSAACSTASARCSRSPVRSRSTSPAGRSSPAASSIATRGSGRRAPHGFFAASGVHFFRLLRLAVVSGVVYWWLFRLRAPLAVSRVVRRAHARHRRRARGLSAGASRCISLFGLLLVLVNVIFDYAKIRLVVEDRRSALGALSAAMRFVWRHRGRVAGLYALNGLAFLGAARDLGADRARRARRRSHDLARRSSPAQLYLLARLALKLQFLASETALFQSRLAHAAYTRPRRCRRGPSPRPRN